MSTKKTIDDLGADSSIRYAIDQHYYEANLIKEAPFVPKQAQIDVTTPAYPSEFDELFGMSYHPQECALFQTPQGFHERHNRLFTFQTLPFWGSEEQHLLYPVRIHEKVQKDKEKKNRHTFTFEEDVDLQEELKESQKLLDVFAMISFLDKILAEMISQRNRYQKG